METCSVVLTFESVDKILWCDHSNETSLAVLLQSVICFSIFYNTKFRILLEYFVLVQALLGLKWISFLLARCSTQRKTKISVQIS